MECYSLTFGEMAVPSQSPAAPGGRPTASAAIGATRRDSRFGILRALAVLHLQVPLLQLRSAMCAPEASRRFLAAYLATAPLSRGLCRGAWAPSSAAGRAVSLMSACTASWTMTRLLAARAQREITLEGQPVRRGGDAFSRLPRAASTRVSLRRQSLDDADLRKLAASSAGEAVAAIGVSRGNIRARLLRSHLRASWAVGRGLEDKLQAP